MAAVGAALLASVGGCMSGPRLNNPTYMQSQTFVTAVENPVYIPLGPPSYGMVFENVLDVVTAYFPDAIAYANRYDGRIETYPTIAPGFEQLWKRGSPSVRERWLATLQTYRHRAVVQIQTADDGGYFVQVTVFKELENLPRPVRQTAGAATFINEPTVQRQYQVIDPTVFESNWIPMGRDIDMEQAILCRIRECM